MASATVEFTVSDVKKMMEGILSDQRKAVRDWLEAELAKGRDPATVAREMVDQLCLPADA